MPERLKLLIYLNPKLNQYKMLKPKPRDNNGSILIRFCCPINNKRVTLSSLGAYADKLALESANSLCTKIYLDYLSGNYDPSLSKYKPNTTDEPINLIKINLAQEWKLFIEQSNQSQLRLNKVFAYAFKILEAHKFSFNQQDYKEWIDSVSSRTVDTYMQCYKQFEVYLTDKYPQRDDLPNFSKWKVPKKKLTTTRNLLTTDQIKTIIEAFESDSFVKKCSNAKASYYLDFIKLFLQYGFRPSELIGLRVCDLDFNKNLINISTALALNEFGRDGNCRERKTTKTGKSRSIPMTQQVRDILIKRAKGLSKDELIFKSVNGGIINFTNWSVRYWKQCLKHLNIDYCVPYSARHSAITHLLDNGLPVSQVAYISGNSLEIISKNYVKDLIPDSLPNLI
jgi:integrase